jgi:hypothetical protein
LARVALKPTLPASLVIHDVGPVTEDGGAAADTVGFGASGAIRTGFGISDIAATCGIEDGSGGCGCCCSEPCERP